jgi:hypothetical protein
MRNWFRQQLINLLVNTDNNVKQRPARIGRNSISVVLDDDICDSSNNSIDLPDPITFKVQTVSGGTVVESRWYDYKKDEQRIKLHIVTPEENLADSIGKIVTMELLQK